MNIHTADVKIPDHSYLDAVTPTGHAKPWLVDAVASASKRAHVRRSESTSQCTLPEQSAADFVLMHDIAKGTVLLPRSKAALEEVSRKIIASGQPILLSHISAHKLDRLHTGIAELAPHLHPSQGNLHTGTRDDDTKLFIIWGNTKPRADDLTPEKPVLTDGKLLAAWLVHEVKGANLKPLIDYSRRSTDLMFGNAHAFKKNYFLDLFYRFKLYGVGIKDGLAQPRFNGVIASNLIITSTAISALLYMAFYGIDYGITENGMPQKLRSNPTPALPPMSPASLGLNPAPRSQASASAASSLASM